MIKLFLKNDLLVSVEAKMNRTFRFKDHNLSLCHRNLLNSSILDMYGCVLTMQFSGLGSTMQGRCLIKTSNRLLAT